MIADAKTKVYGDADPSLTYQVSGLKNGDTAGAVLNGGSLSRVAGENAVFPLAVGAAQGVLEVGEAEVAEHLLDDVRDLLVLEDAAVGGARQQPQPGSLSRVAGENVGVYGINQGGLALNSGNYDLSYQGNNLTITKALLNVIADVRRYLAEMADNRSAVIRPTPRTARSPDSSVGRMTPTASSADTPPKWRIIRPTPR